LKKLGRSERRATGRPPGNRIAEGDCGTSLRHSSIGYLGAGPALIGCPQRAQYVEPHISTVVSDCHGVHRIDRAHTWLERVEDALTGAPPDTDESQPLTVARDASLSTPFLMVRNADVSRLNLGDAGRGVAFLSRDQQQGAHLWFNWMSTLTRR